MRGKQQGILTELKPNVNASAVVQKLLEDMRAAVVARNIPKYENLSDQLAVFSRAYVTPSIPNNWQKYNLTPAETIIVELLHTKLNENVRRTSLMDAVYFYRPDDEPEIKIMDVFICKIRKKLVGSPYRIVNVWGQGYSMVEANSPRENDRFVRPRSAA